MGGAGTEGRKRPLEDGRVARPAARPAATSAASNMAERVASLSTERLQASSRRQWGVIPLTVSTLQEYESEIEGAGRWENLTGLPGPLADALRHFTF